MGGPVKLPISVGLLLLIAAVVSIPAGATRARATLALVDESPVVVVGRGFARWERVTLRTSVNGQRFSRIVRANRLGRFTAQVADVDGECWPFAVSATGARGSRASVRKINIPPPCGVLIVP